MSLVDRQRELLQVFSHVGFPFRSVDQRQLDYDNPRLKGLVRLPKGEAFSTFNSKHMDEVKDFYNLLLGSRDFTEFVNIAFTARELMNEALFVFAVSWAVLDCPLCEGLRIPPIHEIFPDRFIPSETINRAIKKYLDRTNDRPISVTVDEIGSPEDEEYRLAYFREDVGINSHHWHWHLVYPFNGKIKDRQGELFYYMHQQMMARYDCDRLAAGLKQVVALYNFDEPLPGYSPHLALLESGKGIASRPDGLRMTEINHLLRWRERIVEAIHQNYLVDKRSNHIPLDEDSGINLLGAVIEASSDSKNPDFYGNLHNRIHTGIASIHDPKGKFKQLNGVIGEASTAMRDPIFFKIHKFIDDLFNEHKLTLPQYTKQELNFHGIEIKKVILQSKEPNVMVTFMRKATMELNHAIRMQISVKVEYEHLDHDPFLYAIEVNNLANTNRQTTVRIFIAPKYNELGKNILLTNQRRLFIEMDKFNAILVPGENTIIRNSFESSVTAPYLPSFQELKDNTVIRDGQGRNITDSYCSCGWPQHMLVPKGTFRGMDFVLFVMLTDYDKDFVGEESDEPKCSEAVSYCGVKNQKYPDKKAMGFPFDRRIGASTPAEFATRNMSFTDIKIQFQGLKLILGSPTESNQ